MTKWYIHFSKFQLVIFSCPVSGESASHHIYQKLENMAQKYIHFLKFELVIFSCPVSGESASHHLIRNASRERARDNEHITFAKKCFYNTKVREKSEIELARKSSIITLQAQNASLQSSTSYLKCPWSI